MKLVKKNLRKKWSELKKLEKKTADKVSALKSLVNITKNPTLNQKLFTNLPKQKNKFVDYCNNRFFSKT